MKLQEGPDRLLRYFERVVDATADAHAQRGAAMCRWWLEILERESVEQREIDSFIGKLQEESSAGSGWVDLGMQFRSWAREAGFRA